MGRSRSGGERRRRSRLVDERTGKREGFPRPMRVSYVDDREYVNGVADAYSWGWWARMGRNGSGPALCFTDCTFLVFVWWREVLAFHFHTCLCNDCGSHVVAQLAAQMRRGIERVSSNQMFCDRP
ncbi:hypothetical protein SEVIR_9G154250v4 [Setaria viridis]